MTRKYYLLALTFCFFYLISIGQQKGIDSLVDAKDYSFKELIALGKYFQLKSKDTSLSYYRKAVLEAKKLHDVNLQVEALIGMGETYNIHHSLDSAIIPLLQAVELNKDQDTIQKSNVTQRANLFSEVADVYFSLGNYSESMLYCQAAIKQNTKLNSKTNLADNYNLLANVFCSKDDYKNALKYIYQSLRLYEELDDKLNQSRDFVTIGNVYLGQGENNKALASYLKSEKLRVEIKAKVPSNILGGIGNAYLRIGDTLQSLMYFEKALTASKEMNNKLGQIISLHNIAFIHEQKGQFAKAMEYLNKSLNIIYESGMKGELASVWSSMASLYNKSGDYKKANEYLTKSLEAAQNSGDLSDIKEIHFNLSELNLKRRDFEKSLFHYKKYILFRDSIINETNFKAELERELSFNFEKKELSSKAELDKQTAIAEEERQKQIITICSGAAILLIVVIFSTLLYKRFRLTIKQKQIIEEKNKEVEAKNKDIIDSIRYAKRIQTSLLPTEKYIDRILSETDKSTGA